MFKQRNDRVKVLGFTFSLGLCVFMQVMSEMHGQVDPTNIMFVGLIWSLFLIGHLYYWSPISTRDAKHMLRRDWTTCKNEVTILGSRVDTQKDLPHGLSSLLHLYIVLKFGMIIFMTLSWQLILQIY